MARNISTADLQQMFAIDASEVYAILITISHPNLSPAIRITSDNSNIVSRGNTFIPYHFTLTLPTEEPDSLPKASITIDNVDKIIWESIANLVEPPTFLLEVISVERPDDLVTSWSPMDLKDVSGDSSQISGNLYIKHLYDVKVPAIKFTPSRFPNLF